jgi:hypothetical protein
MIPFFVHYTMEIPSTLIQNLMPLNLGFTIGI